ncbi:MAG: rRNA maturation RNase YbeY [Leptolyngbyaceae cyanobacterium SM1_3_5]|nr:rRNA maturation RNase YbeY [Leptolyngbyaceae cyanobacterium SM1_3_5]
MKDLQVEVYVEEAGSIASEVNSETWQSWFTRWLTELEPIESPIDAYELGLRLTDDREIQALNARYRQKDQPTDVLAFAALEVDAPSPSEEEPLYLGDIVISIETAIGQAKAQGYSLEQELAWLAAHGLLHLLGWDHPDDEQLEQMLRQQAVLLQTVGMPTAYD